MKYFHKQLCLFFLLFFVILGGISAFNRYQTKSTLATQSKLPDDAYVLVLGDSHTEYALNPTCFPGMVNCSYSGEHLFYTYAKAKYFIESNPRIRLVILSLPPFRLGKWTEECVWGNQVAATYPIYFPLLSNYPELSSIIVQKGGINRLFGLYYSINLLGIPTKENFNVVSLMRKQLPFVGGFNTNYRANIQKANLDDKIEEHYGTLREETPYDYIGAFELEVLSELMQYIHDRGIQVVLYNAPVHPKYSERIPEFLLNFTDSIAADYKTKYGVEYINHLDYPLSEDSLYLNYDHVNTNGAAIITPIVRDSILRMGLLQNQR